MKSLLNLLFWVTILVFAGCKNETALNSKGVPGTLVVAVFSSDSPDQMQNMYEPVRRYLSKKLNMPARLYYTSDYTGLIEALKSKKVHLAYLGPFAYVIATRTLKLVPVALMGFNGGAGSYHSIIIVKGNSTIKSMAQVKQSSENLSLCFVDPASTSGHLIPRAYLDSIGLNPDTAFKQTIFAGSHISSVLAVKSGKIDIGCSTDLTINRLLKRKMIDSTDLRVLWTSPPIVNSPIVARDDLNKDFVKKIQDCYLNMNRDAPEVQQIFAKLVAVDPRHRYYVVAQDSFYNGLRRIAARIKDLKPN